MTSSASRQPPSQHIFVREEVMEEDMSEEDLERVVVMTDEPMKPSVFSSRTASATTPSRLATWRRWKQQEKPT
jgi:hypothetical protein